MRQANISGLTLRKKGRTTIRVPGVRVCEDLVDRDFLASAPNRLWVADITYLRTWEGWLYLAAVQDAYSRRIVGWSMADHMRTELVTDALQMALERRSPGPGLIHHSDQGSQYVSLAFGQKARAAGIAQSMGSRGDCFDNAVAESFFATLKKELIHRRAWPTKAELRGEVFEYIEVSTTADDGTPDSANSRRASMRGSHTNNINQKEQWAHNQPCPPNRGNSTAQATPHLTSTLGLGVRRRTHPCRAGTLALNPRLPPSSGVHDDAAGHRHRRAVLRCENDLHRQRQAPVAAQRGLAPGAQGHGEGRAARLQRRAHQPPHAHPL